MPGVVCSLNASFGTYEKQTQCASPQMKGGVLPPANSEIYHPPPRNSYSGDKTDNGSRQLDLFFHCFGGGGIYCSQPAGGFTVENLVELCPNGLSV